MGEVRFMISEAAKQVHVESHVLRYWEEELELKIGRTEMGHRYYTEEDIQLFQCIRKLKNEGMLLRDLKPLIPELKRTRQALAEAKLEQASEESPEALYPSEGNDLGQDSSEPNTATEKETADACKTETKDQSLCKDDDSRSPDMSSVPAVPQTDTTSVTQLEQAKTLIEDILSDVIAANNETLEENISRKVTANMIREMDYLFQANERREEEHFRKLDCLIRQQQATRREASKSSPICRLKKIFT